MKQKLFITQGSTGEYSDRTEWLMMAFLTEGEAMRHVEACEARARAWEAEQGDEHGYMQMPENWMGDLGPSGGMGYTGNHYWYEEVMLNTARIIVRDPV